jgi:hypothetical protein
MVIGKIEGFENKFSRPEELAAVNESLEFRSDAHGVDGGCNGKAVAFQDLIEQDDRIIPDHAFTALMAGIASPAWRVIQVLKHHFLDFGPGCFCPIKETVQQGLRVTVTVGTAGNAKNADGHGDLRVKDVF